MKITLLGNRVIVVCQGRNRSMETKFFVEDYDSSFFTSDSLLVYRTQRKRRHTA